MVILHYFFEPTRARRAPAAAGPGTHPKKETGDGTFATPARTRPKREAARGGRGAEKVGRAVGCGPPPPGPGRVRTAELAIARAPATDAGSARRGPTMAGPVSAVDARGIVGPPDARAARESDAAPNLWRAASRGAGRCDRAADALGRPSHGARQQGSERSRAQNANSARARRPRSRKASRRVLGRRRRPRRENCVRKGGAVPFWRPIGLSHDFRRVNPNSP